MTIPRPKVQRPARPARPRRPIRPERPSDPTPDPLANVDYTGDLSEDSQRELTAREEGYRERAKNEAKRFTAATDSEYWFAVCFSDREEKQRFLSAIGLTGHSAPDKYITGRQLAAALGITY